VPAKPISTSAIMPGRSTKPDTFSASGRPWAAAPETRTRFRPVSSIRMLVKSRIRSGVM
jgi:hypothetical protein